MKRKIFCILLFLTPLLLTADQIVLKNGGVINGRIVVKTEEKITIRSASGELTISINNIRQWRMETSAENFLWDADARLAFGDLDGALAALAQSLADGLSYPDLIQFIMPRIESIEKIFAEKKDNKNKYGAQILSLFPADGIAYFKDNPTSASMEFAYYIARMLAQSDQPQSAARLYMSLSHDWYEKNKLNQTAAVNFLKNEILRLAMSGDYDGAVEILEYLQEVDHELGRSSKILLYLKWAARLREQGQWEEAADIYQTKIQDISRELAANRLSFLLDYITGAAKKDSDCERGIKLLQKYGNLLPPDEKSKQFAELSIAAGKIALDDKRTTAARALFQSAFEERGAIDERLLLLCDYKERATQLKPDDYLGHYRLGLFCRKSNLECEARHHFNLALASSELKEEAMNELALLTSKERLKSMADAIKLFDMNEWAACLDLLQPLLNDTTTTQGLEEAARLASLCRQKMQAEGEKRPAKAIVLFQQAERFFIFEDYERALEKLEIILRSYPDVPVARQSKELMQRVKQRRDLARLEGKEPLSTGKVVKPEYTPLDAGELKSQINNLLDSLNEK
ncbi:MAG TPA: hypothetical protein P5557_03800 [Candidatus Sumerlaeia bacterium]|nr:hypothetical protein [Candidatus Sumerlaeia bacterium]